MAARETQSVNALVARIGVSRLSYWRRRMIPVLLIHAFEFAQQLLLQISPRGLLDRASLCGYGFLLSLTLLPCSRFHKLRRVPDLRSLRTGFSLFWFRVRIHRNQRCLLAIKITGIAASCRIVENNATATTDLS